MSVRQAAVAGTFYPSDPDRLTADIRHYLASAAAPHLESPVRGLIVPHAGYVYSGPVAAFAYRCLENLPVKRVVMLGPSHYVPFAGMALPGDDQLSTPLGTMVVDPDAVAELLTDSLVMESPEAHRLEHSLEVQLPFLQHLVPDVSLVPLLTGAIAPIQGADVIEPLLGEHTLLLVSSDLSHYHDADTARRIDAETIAEIERANGAALDRESACGRTAIQIALEIVNRRGYQVKLLDARNSSDTAGPRDRVVGYGAFALGG